MLVKDCTFNYRYRISKIYSLDITPIKEDNIVLLSFMLRQGSYIRILRLRAEDFNRLLKVENGCNMAVKDAMFFSQDASRKVGGVAIHSKDGSTHLTITFRRGSFAAGITLPTGTFNLRPVNTA